MKTMLPSTRSGFTCRIVRAWSACVKSDGDRGAASRHVAACEACQEYFDACDDLGAALRHEANRAVLQVPGGLESRVLRAVHASRAEGAMEPPAAGWLSRQGMLASAAVAIVAVITGGLLFRTTVSHERGVPVARASTDEITFLLETADSLSDRWWNSVLPTATTAVQDNGLQQELNSVVNGARSAWDFLALNFLPTASAAEEAQPGAQSKRTI